MLVLPDNIKKMIANESFFYDKVGMSDSTVIILKDKIIKIQALNAESQREYQIMEWLQDKLPVPKILAYEIYEEKSYLVMTKLPGEMSCAEQYMKNPKQLMELLVEALKMLWSVDISQCSYRHGLEEKLQIAEYNVQNNLVDMEDVEPDTFGKNGFESPQHLLDWLMLNKPEEECTFSHGDFCLPNIILSGANISGFIDLGKAGIADRWQDIALCYRSLLHNFAGKYNGKEYPLWKQDLFFDQLGIVPDWDKIRYYLLLDELF